MAKIKIDSEKCVGCGDCAFICPVFVYHREAPPCQLACPLDTDIQGYLSLIAQEKFADAYELVREVNPLPITTGRVCTRPCEYSCVRAEFDEPLAICSLKRFVTDYEWHLQKVLPARRTKEERIAVIGSGPAGLAAAHDLAMLGYAVTVFEALPVAGGMLYSGIPEYRLPKKLLQAEIDNIKALGVDIRTNMPVGQKLSMDNLWQHGYKAIMLAVGAWKSMRLGVPGEDDFKGVIDSIKFLGQVNSGMLTKLVDRVVVVGGGNAAVDSARSALRLGSKEVSIVYRRSRSEMPAIAAEVEAAEYEGVKVHYLAAPARVLGRQGRVTGLDCIRTELGEPDTSGRKRPLPINGSEFQIHADMIITAVGQQPDIAFLDSGEALKVTEQNIILVDPETLATSQTGVFAAGDVITGPATVVDAIAAGKEAAVSIAKYLGDIDTMAAELPASVQEASEKETVWEAIKKKPRLNIHQLPLDQRRVGFKEVDRGYDRKEATEEAGRCLGCGLFGAMDMESCCGSTCRICVDSCWKTAIKELD